MHEVIFMNDASYIYKTVFECLLKQAFKTYFILFLQYIKGLLNLIGFTPEEYESFFPEQYGSLTDCTRAQFADFISGKMILLRVLFQEDGEYFANILWKLKQEIAPELNKLFCVILDDQARV